MHKICTFFGLGPLKSKFSTNSHIECTFQKSFLKKVALDAIFDGFNYKTIHVPGHSPDSICFYLKDLEILFGGDVLFNGSIGRTDFPNGDTNQLIEGIKNKLFPLKDEVIVFSGHGTETTIGEEKRNNPFLVS